MAVPEQRRVDAGGRPILRYLCDSGSEFTIPESDRKLSAGNSSAGDPIQRPRSISRAVHAHSRCGTPDKAWPNHNFPSSISASAFLLQSNCALPGERLGRNFLVEERRSSLPASAAAYNDEFVVEFLNDDFLLARAWSSATARTP